MRSIPFTLPWVVALAALIMSPLVATTPSTMTGAPETTHPNRTTDTQAGFVAAAHSGEEWSTSKTVAVPSAAHGGDTAVLIFTHSSDSEWSDPSVVADWTLADTVTSAGLTSTVWTKTLSEGDLGASVRFDTGFRARHAVLSLAVYAGVDPSRPVRATSTVENGPGTSHTTPPVTTTDDMVVSYWADRVADDVAPGWNAPADLPTRDVAEGKGIFRYDALLADSGDQPTDGSYPGQVATTATDVSALTWSVVLPAAAGTPPPPPRGATKLMVIMEENETVSGLDQMPFLQSLGQTYGEATNYNGLVHPSLGNYLAIASGQGETTCGLRDPLPAACPQPGGTVFDQALANGGTAKIYAESMNDNCQITNSSEYAARHNPWTYFADQRDACAQSDVPLGDTTQGELVRDLRAGALPDVSMVTPNLVHDAHDGTLGQADDWLSRWIPVLMSGSDYKSGGLAIVITFDEGQGNNQNIPFVVVHPSLSGVVVQQRFDHYGLTRWYDDVLGVPPLKAAATEPGLRGAFGL